MPLIVIYLEYMTNVKSDGIFYKIIQQKIIFNNFIFIDRVVKQSRFCQLRVAQPGNTIATTVSMVTNSFLLNFAYTLLRPYASLIPSMK